MAVADDAWHADGLSAVTATDIYEPNPAGARSAPNSGIPATSVDPFDAEFLRAPFAHHGALRDAGPVVRLDRYGIYAMARHADVANALRDHAIFASGRGVGLADFAHEEPWRPPSLLLEADPPLHDRTRGLMNRVISLPTIRAHAASWRQVADALVDQLVERGTFDGAKDFAEVFPLRVFPDAVGLDKGDRGQLLTYAMTVFNAFGPRNAITLAGERDAGNAAEWVAAACRREHLAPGGWGAAIFQEVDAGSCTEAEGERLTRSLLSAGVDTTVSGLGHMLHALAAFPDQWRQLRKNPVSRKRVFDEVVRWASPVQTFFRTTTADVGIGAHRIPADSKVLLLLGAANRDPRRWSDPDLFEPGRQVSGHVGFGFGIHQCLGQMVSRMEAEVVLDSLLERVATIELIGPPRVRLNNTIHALDSLPLRFTSL